MGPSNQKIFRSGRVVAGKLQSNKVYRKLHHPLYTLRQFFEYDLGGQHTYPRRIYLSRSEETFSPCNKSKKRCAFGLWRVARSSTVTAHGEAAGFCSLGGRRLPLVVTIYRDSVLLRSFTIKVDSSCYGHCTCTATLIEKF